MKKDSFFGRLTVWKGLLGVIVAAGLYATVLRFAHGLGSATHLSDEFPWGVWIGFDVLVGVGLAAGGFVVAATVHIFRMEKYEPIARPTVLTAFLGYLLVIVALLYDLGRPYRIWHPLVMWNPHSVMFEVAWCVTLYTTVLALEFSPLLFERFKLAAPLRIIRSAYVPLVIVGVLLSTMHQSSLGTLYVIAPDKLNGLWYTPLLPAFFLISAIAAGLAMTIFESFLSYRAFGKRLESELLEGIGRVIVVVLAVYAVWKVEDLTGRGNSGLILSVTPESVLFWGEMGLGVILPMVLFAIRRVRQNEHGLFFAAILTVMGFIINRLNVAITGMAASSGVSYFPSWMEFAVTMSIISLGFALFALAVKYLPIFPKEEMGGVGRPEASIAVSLRLQPAFHGGLLLTLWGLLLVGIVAVGFSMNRSNHSAGMTPDAASPLPSAPASSNYTIKLPPDYAFPISSESPGPVRFSHESHINNGKRPACVPCHAKLFRMTVLGKPVRDDLTSKQMHEVELCGSCHNGKEAFSIEDDCSTCHRE